MTNEPVYNKPATPRRLTRSSQDRMLGGVCSGVARYLNVDVSLVRVLTAVGTVLGVGSLLLVYLILWAVLPQE